MPRSTNARSSLAVVLLLDTLCSYHSVLSGRSTGRMVAMLAYLRKHRSAFEAFNVSAAEDMLSQGDDSMDGGIMNDYTLASMIFGPDCGDMRIRFWADLSTSFRHYSIPCLDANVTRMPSRLLG